MATPLVRLAPLDLIRGFVAVGRRMSVTLAAEDLCLTQSAVSRQIHSLEDALGVALFHRGYRSISFTPAGERLFRTADGVVRQLQDAFETIARPLERQPVTITAGIGVTARWLLPRLSDLQRRHPALDVRVAANDKLLDLRAEGIDLAIRCASVTGPAPGATRLFDEAVVAPEDEKAKATTADRTYWLVQADAAAARQDVRDVAQWIVEQAQSATAPAAHARSAIGPLAPQSAQQPREPAEGAALAPPLAQASTTRERVARVAAP
jgi:hypothetical protein